jgi:hypothetical protein
VARVDEVAAGIDWIHPMHGGSLPGDVAPAYTRALRDEAFAYDGRVFGRPIPG